MSDIQLAKCGDILFIYKPSVTNDNSNKIIIFDTKRSCVWVKCMRGVSYVAKSATQGNSSRKAPAELPFTNKTKLLASLRRTYSTHNIV